MNIFENFCTHFGVASCYNFFKDFTPAFVAVAVGLFATYFSLRQWLLAREKLHLDLFDKRLKAFNAFMRKTGCDMGHVALTPEEYSEAGLDTASAEFLFPELVRDEMNRINSIAGTHRRTEARWQGLRDKEYEAEVKERGELAERMRTLRDDYDRRIAALPKLVAGIMRFAHISR
jgi:hypothetical protein